MSCVPRLEELCSRRASPSPSPSRPRPSSRVCVPEPPPSREAICELRCQERDWAPQSRTPGGQRPATYSRPAARGPRWPRSMDRGSQTRKKTGRSKDVGHPVPLLLGWHHGVPSTICISCRRDLFLNSPPSSHAQSRLLRAPPNTHVLVLCLPSWPPDTSTRIS